MSTAPHQPRKKRELTRAVEPLKIKYGGAYRFVMRRSHFQSILY